MKVIRTYVANTAAVISDTITEPDPTDESGNRMQRKHLTGAVSRVDFMAMNEDTGTVDVNAQASVDETGDPATYGNVSLTPPSGAITAERRRIGWWRLTFLSGDVLDTPEFVWLVVPHGVSSEAVVAPTGVCSAWATNEDVARYTTGGVDEDFASWLVEASELLYILSGRQFPGVCTQTVRPHRQGCGCWQVLSRGHIVAPLDWIGGYWRAESDLYTQFGCGMQQAVRLAGYVQAVSRVRIGGVVVDPATYRVDLNEWLVRITDPSTGNPGWPACQNLSLPSGAAGTFDVDYTWGHTIPLAGVRAAAILAYQLYLNDNPQGRQKCALPAGWTSISRQGVTISRGQIQKLATEGTGIVGIDAFISSANPGGVDRPPAVYSRDVQPYARRIG